MCAEWLTSLKSLKSMEELLPDYLRISLCKISLVMLIWNTFSIS